MTRFTTPVVLVLFNRPAHVRRSIERIRAVRPTRLLLVGDGPRDADDALLCEEARAIALDIDWTCDVSTEFSASNLGCRKRVTSGLSWAFSQCEEVIVLEDDCIADPSFFEFCRALLERYRDEPRVMAISGNNFQGGAPRGHASYFLSKYFHIWGWASWRRAWECYEPNVESYPEARHSEKFLALFDSALERELWSAVFERCFRQELDTWDYQWLYSCWMRGGLCVQPAVNLVTNIGCDPELSKLPHGRRVDAVEARTLTELVHLEELERNVEADRYTFETLFKPLLATPRLDSVGMFRRFYRELASRLR